MRKQAVANRFRSVSSDNIKIIYHFVTFFASQRTADPEQNCKDMAEVLLLLSHPKGTGSKNTNQFPEIKNKKLKNREVYSGQLKFKEENNMFASFATKVAVKVVPKLIANPALAVQVAPVLVVVGVAAAIYDAAKN